jgi:hypothetical protein
VVEHLASKPETLNSNPSTIKKKKKVRCFPWDEKIPWSYFKNWPDPHSRLKDIKVQTHLKNFTLKESSRVLYLYRLPREAFPHVQPSCQRPLQLWSKGDLATAHTGDRSWHHLHDAGFASMKNAEVVASQRLLPRFQKKTWEDRIRIPCEKLLRGWCRK